MSVALLGVFFLLALNAGDAPLLRAAAWTQAGPELAHALTHAPPECYRPAREDAQRAREEIGRALFRSPVLLGGPAAREALSCESCHANGRANAHFFLQALTDRPGAADVTSEWSSRTRGDGVMNPRPIPDLAGVAGKASFGFEHVASLDAFVRGVIVEEFQGQAPPDQAFASLIAYLRALDASACPSGGETAITLSGQSEDVLRAVAALGDADAPTQRPLRLAARAAIARIAERLPAAAFARDRAALEALARELEAGPAANWNERFAARIRLIAPREGETYYNEAILAAALSS
ncbi:MAG TPA: hypothetical protein VG841_03135 [Caulobacterales bacterium]|nr:hypothetical protein [Caulobacterales bacterium]